MAIAMLAAAWADEAGAVQDQELLFLQQLDQRVADVSWRISATGAPLCSNHMNAVGFTVHDVAQYAPNYRRAAIDTFAFGDGLPAVLAVAKGGPADLAGVRPGDRISALNGHFLVPVSLSAKARENYASVAATMTRIENLPKTPIIVELLSGQSHRTVMLQPVPVCRSRVEAVPSGQINASSNGDVVQIYGKLALWTKSDDELAIVIAHEMAHNILAHNRRIQREKIGTGIFASFGRNGRKLRDMEREADRFGLFLVARAGYDYRIAPDFWRRLSATAGLGGVWATTHPSASNRAEFNQGVVAEIDRQKAAGGTPTP